jgi:hypothetical protein
VEQEVAPSSGNLQGGVHTIWQALRMFREVVANGRATRMEALGMDTGMQQLLHRRLEDVDQEIADLRSLLTIMQRIERDAVLRERLRSADLGFRLQDVWAGRITGDGLRAALAALEDFAAPVRTA